MTRVVLTSLLALGLGGSLAFVPTAAYAQAGAKKAAVTRFSGTVQSADVAMNKLSVKNSKGEMKDFTLAPEVKITRGGKKVTLAEVMTGDQVTVSSKGDQVTTIAAKAPKASKKS